MSEILLHLIFGIIRFFVGLSEVFGFLFETDFDITGGFFSSKMLVAVRNKIRHHKVA